jgi:hypothetical protein
MESMIRILLTLDQDGAETSGEANEVEPLALCSTSMSYCKPNDNLSSDSCVPRVQSSHFPQLE